MFRQRLLTAVLLLIVFLAVTFYLPVLYFSLIMGVIVAWAAWEWSWLVGLRHVTSRVLYLIITVLLLAVMFFLSGRVIPLILGISLLAWLWAFCAVLVYAKGYMPLGLQSKAFKMFLGWLLLVTCWVSVVELRATSAWSLLIPLILVWVNDSGAYFSGRFWGKRLWVARVSPKKTWVGFFGGIVSSLVAAVIILLVAKIAYSEWFTALLLTVVVALFANLGDLMESMLKRRADVKDSGHVLPGHGGILDRIDSLLAALPIALWFWFMFVLAFQKI